MRRRGASLALLALVAIGCEGGGLAKIEHTRVWACTEGERCSCYVERPNVASGSSGAPVDRCSSFDCCLLTGSGDDAICDCFDSATPCQVEAATRRNVEVVTQCPPPGEEPPPGECAAAGENCTGSYLRMNELEGCCEGTVCSSDASGLRVCTSASAEEIERHHECDKFARTPLKPLQAVEIREGSVMTSVGTFRFDELSRASSTTGSGGCLTGAQVTLAIKQSPLCSLELQASVVSGRFEVTRVSGFLQTCPGFNESPSAPSSPRSSDPQEIPFDFAYEGLSCDAALGVEAYCTSGRYDFHLQGKLGLFEFADQHVVIEGTMCNALPSSDACPAP